MSTRDEGGFAHSMADLMSGVAVTFLLIAAIFMVQAFAARNREAEAERKAQAQLAAIRAQDLGARDFLVGLQEHFSADPSLRAVADVSYDPSTDPYLLTLTLNRERFLFGSSECELSDDIRRSVHDGLRQAVAAICTAPAATERLQAINLEGHTDALPFFPRQPMCGASATSCRDGVGPNCSAVGFENNVRLSGERAQRLFFALRSAVGGDPRLAQCLDRWFVVSGRGPVEARGIDDETRRHDRRVVLRVRVRAGAAFAPAVSNGATGHMP